MQLLTVGKMNWSLSEACLVSLASLLLNFFFDFLFHFLFHFLFKLQKCLFYPGIGCMGKIVGVSSTK